MSPTLRRTLPWILFVLALVATALLGVVRGEDLSALSALSLPALLALLALQVVYLWVQSGRFHVVLVRFARRELDFWRWFELFVLGRFLNLFVPQAGNVYRALELRRRFDIGIQEFLVAFVNAPWLAMLLNFLFGAAAVGLLAPRVLLAGVPLVVALLVAALITALAPFVALTLLPLVPQRFRATAWLRSRLAEMVGVTLESLRERRYLLRVSAWTLASFVQATAMLYVGFIALGLEVGVAEAVAFYVLLQLATYLQVTPGNLGLQELAFGALSVGFGASISDGVLVSAMVRLTGVVALVVAALPLGGLTALREARGAAAHRSTILSRSSR